MVNATHLKQHALKTTDESLVANPYSVSATWDQISVEALRSLSDDSKGYAIIDNFFDEGTDSSEWMELIREDIERLHGMSIAPKKKKKKKSSCSFSTLRLPRTSLCPRILFKFS